MGVAANRINRSVFGNIVVYNGSHEFSACASQRAELPPRETHGRRLALPPDAEYQARLPDRERVAVVLQHVLRRDEAQAVIDATEARGYEAALFGGTKAYNLRKSARCLAEDKDFADRLYARVREYLPPFWTDEFGVRWRLSGVDDRLRFLRYRGGDGFKPHRDGAQCTASDDRHSFMTLMLYLNDATPPGFNSEDFDCLGGCLGFLGTTRTSMGTSTESSTGGDTDPAYAPGGQGERVSFVQRAGDVVLFEHGILHEGEPVDTGVKYCMRTDIMYEAIPGEAPRAPPAHIVIDSGKGGDIRRLAPDGFVQHPLPPSSYVQFALGADEAAAASDGTAPPTRPPLYVVVCITTHALLLTNLPPLQASCAFCGNDGADGTVGRQELLGRRKARELSSGESEHFPSTADRCALQELRGVDREVRLEDVVVTVTNAGKTDCNGVYVMYQKNGMVKPYAGRLMWKGLDSVVELAASPGAQPRSPYMIFWDGQVWWLGFGLYRNDNHDGPTPTLASDGTASGWLDHDKRYDRQVLVALLDVITLTRITNRWSIHETQTAASWSSYDCAIRNSSWWRTHGSNVDMSQRTRQRRVRCRGDRKRQATLHQGRWLVYLLLGPELVGFLRPLRVCP